MSEGLCTSCGAAVNLAAGQDEINCTYCGTLVKRPEAEAQFAEVKNSKFGGTLLIAETSREGGSYEEAIAYYNKVIEQDPTFADAWLNKGICMLWNSKIGDLKTTEAISSWKAAIKFAKHPEAMKKRVAKEIEKAVSAFYPVLDSHYKEFSTLDNSYAEHVSRFLKLENALALALELSPTNPDVCTTGINLCGAVLSAATDAGANNAAAALMNKDWKGAITSAVGGFSAAATIRKPVEDLKVKYQRALAAIDPNYKAPALPEALPSASSNKEQWKEAVVASVKAIDPKAVGLYAKSKIAQDFLAFISPSETADDVLFFEPLGIVSGRFLIVTTAIIGWGRPGIEKKGFFSPGQTEEKTVIPHSQIIDVIYLRTGLIGKVAGNETYQRPRMEYRNAFGVKESVLIPTEKFKEQTKSLLAMDQHKNAEAFVLFLKNWASKR